MRRGIASSLPRLGASLLAVILCVLMALPSQALTSNTRFPSAIRVADETVLYGVFEVVAQPCTGLFCHADPVNLVDPSGYYATSTAEVGVSLGTAITIDTLAISAIATIYVNYAIYSGAKGIYDDYRINKVAQQLGVEVEPAAYLPDLKNDVDWSSDERKRDSGWEYFAHGTQPGHGAVRRQSRQVAAAILGLGFTHIRPTSAGCFSQEIEPLELLKTMGGCHSSS